MNVFFSRVFSILYKDFLNSIINCISDSISYLFFDSLINSLF